jgi:hypothetical protein
MAWSFDVASNIPRLNQSGTDTGLTGIATAITAVATVARSTAYTTVMLRKPPTPNGFWYRCSTAGTSAATAPTYGTTDGGTTTDGTSVWTAFKAPDVQTLGTANHYYMPAIRMAINGTLTNSNPQQENFTCLDLIIYTGNFTSGAWASDGVTPRWDGVHFIAIRSSASGADGSSMYLQSGGQFTFIGGEVQTAGGVTFENATTPRCYYTRWRNTKEYGASSARFRSSTVNAIFQNVEIYDFAFDLFRMPTVAPSIKARGSEYIYQYVGAAFGGADAKFAASSLENPDGTFDFDNFGSGWVELYNCAKGANLNVYNQNPSTPTLQKHCVPLYQDLRITAKDTTGAAIENVRFNTTDVPNNSPTVTFITAGNLKTWDFRNQISYEATTNASGIALSSPVLQVWYYQSSFKKNLRFPLSTATYQGRAYNYKTMNVSVVLGSNSIQDVSAGMIALDTATTITETAASALTGITLTPSGTTGGTITISSNKEYQDIWNYYRWWISQFTNKTSNDTWTCTGGILNTQNWNIVVNTGVTLTSSTEISTLRTLGTVTLNGTAKITAVYQDTTGTSTVLTISGFGANSAVYVEDNNGVQKYFNADVTGSVVLYIPPTATGSWYYAIEKFGNQRQSDFFTFSGGQKSIVVKELPDNKILLSKAQITALTSGDNPDEAYDAIALLRTGLPYISFGQIVSKDGSTLYGADYDIVIDADAENVVEADYDTKVITIKSALFEAGPVCNLVKVDVPKTVTANATEVINVNIEDNNGDSTTEIKGVSGSLVDVWKCTNGTLNVDYATGTKISENIGAGKYRFIHQDGFKLIFFDKDTLMARDCSMSKGTYTLGWYVYNNSQGGLDQNQSDKFETIFSKVDVIDDNVVSVKGTVEGLSAGSGATLAEIEASTVIAMKADVQAVETKVDALPTLAEMEDPSSVLAKQDLLSSVFNVIGTLDDKIDQANSSLNSIAGNDFDAMTDSLDAISTKVDQIKTSVEDKTGYSLTTAQVEAIAVAVEAHLLDEGDSQQLVNAIVGAIGNANIDETVLVSAIRADIERADGMLKAVKTKVDTLNNADFSDTNQLLVDLGSPLQAEDYVAPDNAKIISIKATVETLSNYNDTALIAKIDAIKTIVEDKTGYSLTTTQVNAIAVAVESHLLNEGDSQQLINAIVSAIGNSNVDQTILIAAIRSDLERTGGKLDAIETSVDLIENYDDTTLIAKVDVVKTKVNTLENADFTVTNDKIDALAEASGETTPATIKAEIKPMLEKLNEGLQTVSNFEPYEDDLPN